MPKRVSKDKFIKYLLEFFLFWSIGQSARLYTADSSGLDAMHYGQNHCALARQHCMMYKVLPAKQSCFSRILEITVHAGDVFFTTTRRPFCNDTGQHGYTIFQPSGKSPSAVRMVTAGKSTRKFSPKPVSYTMQPSAPSRPTSFEHCLNSTGVPTRCWTPLPCIYRRCHQCWRVTRYHKYEKLSRRRPGK